MLKGKKFDAFALVPNFGMAVPCHGMAVPYHGTEILKMIREQIHRELKTFLYYGYI